MRGALLTAMPGTPRAALANTVRSWRRGVFRLSRAPAAGSPPLVSPALAWSMVAALALVLVAAAFDPLVVDAVGTSQWPAWRFLAAVTDAARVHWYLVPSGAIALVLGSVDWRAITSQAVRARLFLAHGRAAFIFVAIAAPAIVINVIKQVVGRGRPVTRQDFDAFVFAPFEFDYAYQSFPSGHATTSGALAMLLALWFPRRAPLALVFGACLAFARVPAGAHYLSDVIAGFAIGAASTLVLARWLARRRCLFRFGPSRERPVLIK
ncbi:MULTISPECIES: phosphatase PAP2 family protein [unclassified Roseitalea]|uniref:phosphatase PAP2 family protein n=1 Tax=unclassified Roseitalea TaxID=2639107 RepID=UPI00273ECD06|nr:MULTISPECIES: phosphatase PAP2 family protein [unclassified Roseitalea]